MRAVFFGDSWTLGRPGSPYRGYAHVSAELLGWDAEVIGGGGSGYTRVGVRTADYLSRLRDVPADATVDVVVMQGSVNDTRRVYVLPFKSLRVLALARRKFPNARIIVLGPAPATPTASAALRLNDFVMTVAARIMRMPYVSPVRERWITEANYSTVIEPDYHPGTDGHEYLADRLVPVLRGVTPRARARSGEPHQQ